MTQGDVTRRRLLQGMAAAALMTHMPSIRARKPETAPLARPIPSTGEMLPVVGLGSWITFNVGNDRQLLDESAAVIDAFLQAGGALIDSSPMYGSAQATIGYGLAQSRLGGQAFAADKVWLRDAEAGAQQIADSLSHWRKPRFDLLQVHNLLSWEAHLDTLQAMKQRGDLRYLGVTTSHGRRHDAMEQAMRQRPLDFIQLTYNPLDREAEQRLLPLAAERGIAVIVNRPFQQGDLTRRLRRERLPGWATEIGVTSWAQFILKFILSHPAVTCVIPATTRVDHVRENMAAATSPFPDANQRRRIADDVRKRLA
ncbi:aldo/keto reductase [Hahella aquimaris]|uniref:aldo/keto reductase n=1 Tax=Hahella sp. HNIBRBA332 TaxID=3015983 RepID=UPI00273B1FD6|nr:aldo/keto reductase [Hahella sp. HNIBRBA332]WLQ13626.1 aldo/keto reductase [Hahella sp. HNIBRBA332]